MFVYIGVSMDSQDQNVKLIVSLIIISSCNTNLRVVLLKHCSMACINVPFSRIQTDYNIRLVKITMSTLEYFSQSTVNKLCIINVMGLLSRCVIIPPLVYGDMYVCGS